MQQELDDAYTQALIRELDAGASPVVARGRALVARLRAQIDGVADDDDPGLTPEQALGGGRAVDAVFEAVVSAQLGAGATRTIAEARATVASVADSRKRHPRPPTPVKPRETRRSAPQTERPAIPTASGAPKASEPSPPAGPVAEESPEQAYERVLAEQREAGVSEAVAVARAKVARTKAERAAR